MKDYLIQVTDYTGVPDDYEYEDQGQVLIYTLTVEANSEEEAIQKVKDIDECVYPGNNNDFWEDCDDMDGWASRIGDRHVCRINNNA